MNCKTGLMRAKKEALKSTYQNKIGQSIRMGAVIYCGNRLVACSCNKEKGHPMMSKYNDMCLEFYRPPKLHAEMSAILEAKKTLNSNDLSSCSIYIYRKLNRGTAGLARPCPACMQAIKDCGIKRVVYTTDEGFAVEHIYC